MFEHTNPFTVVDHHFCCSCVLLLGVAQGCTMFVGRVAGQLVGCLVDVQAPALIQNLRVDSIISILLQPTP
jgi:hypothetical protein